MHHLPDGRPLYLMGDYHRQEERLATKLEEVPAGSSIIQLGDLEVRHPADLIRLDDLLRKGDHRMYALRGNHDKPQFWMEGQRWQLHEGLRNLVLLGEVDCLVWRGIKIITVSGAVSVDRTCVRHDRGECWPDEEQIRSDAILRVQNMGTCDVLLTHAGAPESHTGKDVFVQAYAGTDEYLERDIARERQVVQKLQVVSGCSRHFYGHFHMSHAEEQYGIRTRCLDICELCQLDGSC